MKKIFLLAAMLFILAACGSDNEESPFYGIWVYHECNDGVIISELGTRLEFREEGFTRTVEGVPIEGTFELDEDAGTFTVTDNDGSVQGYEYTFEDEDTLLIQSGESYAIYIRLKFTAAERNRPTPSPDRNEEDGETNATNRTGTNPDEEDDEEEDEEIGETEDERDEEPNGRNEETGTVTTPAAPSNDNNAGNAGGFLGRFSMFDGGVNMGGISNLYFRADGTGICNQQVIGSSPIVGLAKTKASVVFCRKPFSCFD